MDKKILIVNADDFGMTDGVTHGVVFGHQFGIVSSTCLMANMPGRFSAAQLAKAHPDLGVGVHLNMTCWRPLLPPEEVPSLVTANGGFYFDIAEASARADLGQLEREFRAQLEEARTLGIHISHVDLHMGTTKQEILELIMVLAAEYGLPMRRPPKDYVPGLDAWLRTQGDLNMPDHTEYFNHERIRVEMLVEFIGRLQPGVTEIMCHPGYISPEHQYIDTLLYPRVKELEALLDRRVKDVLAEEGVELASFHCLRQ